MKSKQLANVVIKMMGLWVCLHTIPAFIFELFCGMILKNDPAVQISAATGLEAFFAIILVLKSRCVAEWMFKGEEG